VRVRAHTRAAASSDACSVARSLVEDRACWQVGEEWLFFEAKEPHVADESRSLTPDERIVRCASRVAASRADTYSADRIILATLDNNAAMRAASAGVEVASLDKIRLLAEQRTAAWRAAYANQRASDALEAAAWAQQGQQPQPRDRGRKPCAGE
jgi:hypothetical protein